ncbi:LytR/AlgR family response regulator transcription factor [Arundinibacter roseus]|nr:LytTR family DNA-binding domain-containing protein [Arundinibacter roseus]
MKSISLTSLCSYVHIGGHTQVHVDEILFCSGDRNYTQVHFTDGRKLLVATTLGTLEERLCGRAFMRLGRSELINLKYVDRFDQNRVVLINGQQFYLSRRRKKRIHELLCQQVVQYTEQRSSIAS